MPQAHEKIHVRQLFCNWIRIAFRFLGLVGPGAFTTKGAEIRTRHYDGDTYVYLDTDRDTTYEAKGMIEGIHHLTASDFLL